MSAFLFLLLLFPLCLPGPSLAAEDQQSSATSSSSSCAASTAVDMLSASFRELAGPGFEAAEGEGIEGSKTTVAGIPLQLSIMQKGGDHRHISTAKVLAHLKGSCCATMPQIICPAVPSCQTINQPARQEGGGSTTASTTKTTTTSTTTTTSPQASPTCPPGPETSRTFEFVSLGLGSGGVVLITTLAYGLWRVCVKKDRLADVIRDSKVRLEAAHAALETFQQRMRAGEQGLARQGEDLEMVVVEKS